MECCAALASTARVGALAAFRASILQNDAPRKKRLNNMVVVSLYGDGDAVRTFGGPDGKVDRHAFPRGNGHRQVNVNLSLASRILGRSAAIIRHNIDSADVYR